MTGTPGFAISSVSLHVVVETLLRSLSKEHFSLLQCIENLDAVAFWQPSKHPHSWQHLLLQHLPNLCCRGWRWPEGQSKAQSIDQHSSLAVAPVPQPHL